MSTNKLGEEYIEDIEYNFNCTINYFNNTKALIGDLKYVIKEKDSHIKMLETKIQELEAINDNK